MTFSLRSASALFEAGGFDGDQREQLQQVILEHIAQNACPIVVAAAMLDIDLFGNRDLDMIDVIAIPDRLENRIGEAEEQDVLDGLFTEIMIDTVDLIFLERLMDDVIERLRRTEIVAEGFLDNQTAASHLPDWSSSWP